LSIVGTSVAIVIVLILYKLKPTLRLEVGDVDTPPMSNVPVWSPPPPMEHR